MPAATKTIFISDGVAVVFMKKNLKELTHLANQCNDSTVTFDEGAVLVISRKIVEAITRIIGRCDTSSQISLRDLAVQIDTMLRFDVHLRTGKQKSRKGDQPAKL